MNLFWFAAEDEDCVGGGACGCLGIKVPPLSRALYPGGGGVAAVDEFVVDDAVGLLGVVVATAPDKPGLSLLLFLSLLPPPPTGVLV